MTADKNRPLKIAVIGGGIVGPKHARHIIGCVDTILVGLVEPAPTGLRIASNLKTAHFSSVAQLLNSTKPDGAIIAAPTQLHASVARKLIAQGIHVLVENTISLDVESGEDLVDMADSKGVSLLVGHYRRFHPSIVAAKKALDSGQLGTITAISGSWTLRKPMDYLDTAFPSPDWKEDKHIGKQLYLNLIHDIDLLQYLAGPITRVYAENFAVNRPFGVKERTQQASVTLLFESGAIGTFMLSDYDSSRENSFGSFIDNNNNHSEETSNSYYIFGTTASLSIPEMSRYSFDDSGLGWTSKMKVDTMKVEPGASFDLQLAHFVNVIRGKEKPNCSGKEGVSALKVATAVQDSLDSRRPIDIK